MWKIHFLLIIGMLLTACSGEQHAPTASAPERPAPVAISGEGATETAKDAQLDTQTNAEDTAFTIVMLGDSLTAGFDLAIEEALPDQVALLLESKGYDVNVINAGVSGDTTAGGLARYDWSVASANPDLLIVALGANDFLGGLSPTRAKDNLGSILERAKADGLEVILASVEAGNRGDDDPRIAEYSAIYPELAEAYDVPLFEDILRGVRDDFTLVQLDGLHPTRDGVKLMARRMARFLEPHLPKEASAP